MKNLIKLLSICIVLLLNSCQEPQTPDGKPYYKDYSEEAALWIKTHPKPIQCVFQKGNLARTSYNYTLIDSNGEIYNTNRIKFNLPKEIK